MDEQKLGQVILNIERAVTRIEKKLDEHLESLEVPLETVSGEPYVGPTNNVSPAPQQYDAVCSDCGKNTTVPFKPNPKWPIRCTDCFKLHKNGIQN